MKITLLNLIFLISFLGYSQKKTNKYFNEIGNEIDRKTFYKSKNYSENIDVSYENDTAKFNLLVKRMNSGELDKNSFLNLKNYLSALSSTEIDSTKFIVINYLSYLPNKAENSKLKSSWNIFDDDYLKNLFTNNNVQHFWINSPNNNNLEYFHKNSINWISDRNNVFNKIFFKYDVRYGYFLIINPNGKFAFYIGEYSKQQVWNLLDEFVKI